MAAGPPQVAIVIKVSSSTFNIGPPMMAMAHHHQTKQHMHGRIGSAMGVVMYSWETVRLPTAHQTGSGHFWQQKLLCHQRSEGDG